MSSQVSNVAALNHEKSQGNAVRSGDVDKRADSLPDGWTSHVDPESSCMYYFHAASGQSTWEKPKPPSTLPSPPPRSSLHLQNAFPKSQAEDSSNIKNEGPHTLHTIASNIRGVFQHREPAGLLWDNRAFIDLFLDGWKEHEKHTLTKGFLAYAIILVEEILDQVNQECEQHLKQIGHDKLVAMKNLDHFIASMSSFSQSLPLKSKSEQQVLEFIHSLTAAIRNLPKGGFLAVPGGWVSNDDSFVLLLIVERTGLEEFAVAVCNTGPDGLSYHPLRADPVESCNMLYRMCMVIDHVPEPRIADSSFWFMITRMQVIGRRHPRHYGILSVLISQTGSVCAHILVEFTFS